MSKFIDLADRIARDDLMESAPGIAYVRDALEWLDEHPDQVPGRTITESEFRKLYLGVPPYKDYLSYAKALATALGITIVPDPKPTNKEKLLDLLDGHIQVGEFKTEHLAEYLVGHGVTVSGGDDD